MSTEQDYIQLYQKILIGRKNNKYCKLNSQSDGKKIRCGNIPARILLRLLDICEVGDGDIYEHLVMDSIAIIFPEIIDSENVEQHFSSKGGLGDIEFPFCTETLHDNPCWKPWYYLYGIKSIIVEVKNKKNPSGPDEAGQIKRYLDTAKKGKFGILVSRSGFTLSSMKTLRAYAEDNLALILPLEHDDLKELLKLSMNNPIKVMRFLRRKETLLLRIR